MEDILRQLSVILRGMWLYRWWGLAAAWIVGPIAAAAVYLQPDRYEASARVYVDTQSILKPLMSGLAVQPNVDQQINILSRTLISRPNVEKLIRMADLDLAAKTKEEREALIVTVTKALQIREAGRDNIYTLAYTDTDAQRAKRVVQSMVSIFVESGLGDKRKDSDTARRFIEDQIKAYEQRLVDAENRLKEYKLRNMSTVGSGAPDYFRKVADATEQLNQARLALREAENSRDALKRQFSGEDSMILPERMSSASLASVSVPELDGRIESQKKSLDALLLRYTDQHPDVVAARKLIEELEAQKSQEIQIRRKTMGNGPAMAGAGASPVMQQMKIALGEAEANVASLKARVSEYESRVQQLAAVLAHVLRIGEQLAGVAHLHRPEGQQQSGRDDGRPDEILGQEIERVAVAKAPSQARQLALRQSCIGPPGQDEHGCERNTGHPRSTASEIETATPMHTADIDQPHAAHSAPFE